MVTRTRRSLIRMATGAALTAFTSATRPTQPAAAETTHEANQAAAEIASATRDAAANMTADEAIDLITGADGVLRFDVAEDGTRFTWSGDPALTEGMPDHDTAYVTQGYIYPEGTLTGSNGVTADGAPEFPDQVLGQWTCSGWYVGAGTLGQTAPWITSHLFNFGNSYGAATLVSEGYSIDDVDVALARAIVGGTGTYAGARGVQRETVLGHNPSNGVDFRYEVHVAES